MHIPPELLPVVQITVPLIAAIFSAAWLQNKRIDDIATEVRELTKQVREMRQDFGDRLARLEERTPPLIHC